MNYFLVVFDDLNYSAYKVSTRNVLELASVYGHGKPGEHIIVYDHKGTWRNGRYIGIALAGAQWSSEERKYVRVSINL